jgi:hypothetical protein
LRRRAGRGKRYVALVAVVAIYPAVAIPHRITVVATVTSNENVNENVAVVASVMHYMPTRQCSETDRSSTNGTKRASDTAD